MYFNGTIRIMSKGEEKKHFPSKRISIGLKEI